MNINETQKQFLMTEYVQLKNEIILCVQGIENTERYALVFSGAIWAWLVTQKWNIAFFVVLFIPTLITALFEIKRRSLASSINLIATYIKNIEDAVGITDKKVGKLGWEHRDQDSKEAHAFRKWRKLYWKLLRWGDIVIGLIYLITSLIIEYNLFNLKHLF